MYKDKNRFFKKERVSSSISFKEILKKAKLVPGSFLSLYYLRRDITEPHSRLGIILSKKVLPNSVDRNKIKRLVREIFRTNKQKIIERYDIIFKVYKPPAQASYQYVQMEIIGLLKKTGIIK